VNTLSPSWYDLLGVAPDASADQVRAAWRDAIADLDPTDRRFAVLNQAAEVLLDQDRRAAYDAELAAARPEQPRAEAGEPQDEPDVQDEAEPSQSAAAARERRLVPGWLLIGVAVVTLLLGGSAAVVAATVPADRDVEDAASSARAAAERAIVPVLSYDGAHLDQSKSTAEQYITGDYRKEYDKLFDGVIAPNAPSTGTVVTAKVARAGVTRADQDRVQVFLLVDQSRTNKKSSKPVVYQNWVTATMEKVDGDWLISGLET
jgi:Mce-associated membrane protein